MTTFLELAKDRYSVRSFTTQPVETEKLAQVLEATRVAPTACNGQPQRIKIITSDEELAKIDQCTPSRFGAPAVLLVCYDKSVCWKRQFDGALSGEVDASIVATHVILAAQDMGLGSCWVMFFDPKKVRELFELPDTVIPVAILPIGYPKDDAAPSKQHGERLPLDKIIKCLSALYC